VKEVTLTAARVLNLQCEPGKQQSIYWDTKSPGFGLRITQAGARSYVFESRLFGKSLRVTIGDAQAWELGKARTEAARLKTLVDTGLDPRLVRQEQRRAIEEHHRASQEARAAATRKEGTFGDAWEVYLEARRPYWSDRHLRDHVQHAKLGGVEKVRGKGVTQSGPLANLRSDRLCDLSGERIAGWLKEESRSRPTMTALSFRLLRGFIRWANETPAYAGLIPGDAYRARVVADSVPRVRPKEGDVLQREPRWPGQIPPPLATPNSPRQDRSDYDDSGVMAMRAAASLRR
jgi:hypothetical protein